MVTFGREWSEEQRQWEPAIKVDRGLILSAGTEAGNETDAVTVLELPGAAAERKKKPEISASLLSELTSHRTMALRAVMATDPATALDTLVWTLAAREFLDCTKDDAVAKIHIDRDFPGEHEVAGSRAAREINDIRDRWADTIPGNSADLWEWMRHAPQSGKLDLLAYLVALSINAVQQYGRPPIPNSHQVHAALGLDMAGYWEPTADSFLHRVPKDKVIEALADAGESRYRLADFARMKKPVLAASAEKALAGKGWLPAALRVPEEAGAALADEDRDGRRQAAA